MNRAGTGEGQERCGTVLVTGGCGYLGSQCIRTLLASPAGLVGRVRVLDSMNAGGYRALMDLGAVERLEFLEGDILDPAVSRQALRGVDAVVHLAAEAHTPFSAAPVASLEQVNHWGTVRLVEECLHAGVARMVFASSASVYGQGGPFDESSPCQPFGAYAKSKWSAERSVLSAAGRGLRATVLRFGTLFGHAPSMRFDAVPNRFAFLAATGRPLPVYGTGQQKRPLVHVRDAADAILLCLLRPVETVAGEFNVVARNVSILEIVECLRAVKPELRTHYTEQDVLSHITLEVDGSRLQRTGWQPGTTLEAGLAEVVERFSGISSVRLSSTPVEELG